MLRIHIIDMVIRTIVFISSIVAYALKMDIAAMWQGASFFGEFSVVVLVWFLMMLGMIIQFATNSKASLISHKDFMRYYNTSPRNYSEHQLQTEVKKMNARAMKTLLFWLFLSGIVTALYFGGIFGKNEVLMVVITYYFCDSLCMIFWCPLQKMFMKSRCCINCRIYGWGYFFDFGLLLLLPSFFTYSLVVMSLLWLIKWELAYVMYPERFWSGSNIALRCRHCTDKSCTIKRKLSDTRYQKSTKSKRSDRDVTE